MDLGRRRTLLTLLALAAVAALVVLVADPFEPRHRGMRASDFVYRIVATNRFSSADVEVQLEPMGAALAVPALMKVAEREDSLWRRWYQPAFNRAPFAVRKHLPVPKSDRLAIMKAIVALGAFGPEAAPAVPALTVIHDRCGEFEKGAVVNALERIGPEARGAIPSLLSGLAPTNEFYLRLSTISCLARIDPAGTESSAGLAPLLRDADESVAFATVGAFAVMTQRSPNLIPLITGALRHESPRVRGKAAETLGKLGTEARNAAPELRELTRDDWLNVREAATNALRRIGE